MIRSILFFCFFTTSFFFLAQNEVKFKEVKIDKVQEIDPLGPSRAAFYSAVFPGLGQIYNKSYWKAPIVWGAMGTSIYYYLENNKKYNRFRQAYKRRLDGFKDDEFYGNRQDGVPMFSDEGLRRGQRLYRRNKELSLLVTVGFYVLNIIEANVQAHLDQYNVNENLSFTPVVNPSNDYHTIQWGMSVNLNL